MSLTAFLSKHNQSVLRASLLFMLLALLAATLWPFNPYPSNDVAWIGDANGLRFGRHGAILSTGEFGKSVSRHSFACSLEVWIEPSTVDDSNVILDFYHTPKLTDFSLRQDGDELQILRDVPDDRPYLRKEIILAEQVFAAGKPAHLVVTSGATGTLVFMDGRQIVQDSRFSFMLGSMSGRLIFGDSTVRNDNWSGVLRGLAIYDRELTQQEAALDYSAWTKMAWAKANNSHLVALFTFDGRSGPIVHNRVSGPDLTIPVHYSLVRHSFLTPPWREYNPSLEYVKDIVENVIGFMPLGFLLCAYLSIVRKWDRAIWKTMGLCVALSLFIEIVQAFLPTRTSGLTDVITNGTGGLLGAFFFNLKLTRAIFRGIGLEGPLSDLKPV